MAVRDAVIFDPDMTAIVIYSVAGEIVDRIAADQSVFAVIAGLIAVGDTDRVPELCRAVAATFAAEGLSRNAKKALAYLSETVGSGNAAPEDVRHVRTYLARLSVHPQEEFQQLQ